MKDLMKQSTKCRKYFAAGLITGIGAEEMALRLRATNWLIADNVDNLELIEVFYNRVDMELDAFKTTAINKGFTGEEANEWAKDIRTIIEKSGFVDDFINGVIVIN